MGNLHEVWFQGRWLLNPGASLFRTPCVGSRFDVVPNDDGCHSRPCGIGSPGLSCAVWFVYLVPRCFLVDVMHRVIIDFGKSLHCMLVDQFMVLIQGVLPVRLPLVL